MEIRAIAPNEWNYTYSQSMQITGQTGNIGHLRGDFDSGGYGFYTTWSDHRPQWKTDEFKTELDEVINTLRSKEYGLLQNRPAMSEYARRFPDSAFKGNYCTEYGFRVDTEKYAYLCIRDRKNGATYEPIPAEPQAVKAPKHKNLER